MKTDVTVRPMLSSEASYAAALERLVFSDPWSEDDLSGMCDSAYHRILCAVSENDEFLGYLSAGCICGECEILRVATRPDARRCGIGRALINTFIAERKNFGDTVIFLEVRASNTPAISLYRSALFEEYATRQGYYKVPTEDAVMMRLDLDKWQSRF